MAFRVSVGRRRAPFRAAAPVGLESKGATDDAALIGHPLLILVQMKLDFAQYDEAQRMLGDAAPESLSSPSIASRDVCDPYIRMAPETTGPVASPLDDQQQLRTAHWTRPPLPARPGGAEADVGLESLIAGGGQAGDRCCSLTKRAIYQALVDRSIATAVGQPQRRDARRLRGCSARPAVTLSPPKPRLRNVAIRVARRGAAKRPISDRQPDAWFRAERVSGCAIEICPGR